VTQPNDSFTRSPDGTGTQLPTHAVAGKEFPVVMQAGPSGHIEGSLDTYLLTIPPQAVGANKLHLDLFNGSAASVIKVRGAWVIVAQDVANTGAVSIRIDWLRTSAVGTGGTAAGYNVATLTPTFVPKDTANAALPAGITARAAPTAGATVAAWLFPTYHQTEELQVGGALSQWQNVLPNPDRGEQELTLRPGQGLLARQGAVAGAGNIAILISLTVEA
jgi:hypothetical protein